MTTCHYTVKFIACGTSFEMQLASCFNLLFSSFNARYIKQVNCSIFDAIPFFIFQTKHTGIERFSIDVFNWPPGALISWVDPNSIFSVQNGFSQSQSFGLDGKSSFINDIITNIEIKMSPKPGWPRCYAMVEKEIFFDYFKVIKS